MTVCYNRQVHEAHPYHPFDGDHTITVECNGEPDLAAGDSVILTTQESRGPGVVLSRSVLDGRLIVRWADGRTTLPKQELLRRGTH